MKFNEFIQNNIGEPYDIIEKIVGKEYYLVDNINNNVYMFKTILYDVSDLAPKIVFLNINGNALTYSLQSESKSEEKWNFELIRKWKYRLNFL